MGGGGRGGRRAAQGACGAWPEPAPQGCRPARHAPRTGWQRRHADAAGTAPLPCRHLQFKVKEFEAARQGFERLTVLEPKKRVYAQWVNMCRVQLGGAWELSDARVFSDVGAHAASPAPAGAVGEGSWVWQPG